MSWVPRGRSGWNEKLSLSAMTNRLQGMTHFLGTQWGAGQPGQAGALSLRSQDTGSGGDLHERTQVSLERRIAHSQHYWVVSTCTKKHTPIPVPGASVLQEGHRQETAE